MTASVMCDQKVNSNVAMPEFKKTGEDSHCKVECSLVEFDLRYKNIVALCVPDMTNHSQGDLSADSLPKGLIVMYGLDHSYDQPWDFIIYLQSVGNHRVNSISLKNKK